MEENVLNTWGKVLQIFEKQISRPAFEMWFKPAFAIDENDDYLIIGVPSEFARDWLLTKYYDVIKETVDVIKNKNISLEFEVIKKEDEEESVIEPQGRNFHLSLNKRYTFSNFVVGAGNKLAYAACTAVSKSPGVVYNPLYIYGGVGLGKTHLLHAVAHEMIKSYQNKKILYTTAENFTNEVIYSIQNARINSSIFDNFHKEYRTADILLIDDIQFLAGKERTQEEFFHIFNTLYDAHKQIIITSDVLPKEIATLGERLSSRFEWGLIADISPPDFETRVAILRKKAEFEKMNVSDEVINYLASNIFSNIRELEGGLMRILASASLTNQEITLSFAEETLKDIIPISNKTITLDLIQKVISHYFKIPVDNMKAKKRSQDVSVPRQIAMFLSRELTDASLPYIGEKFGGRDHTTVLYAYQKIKEQIKKDETMKVLVDDLVKLLKKG